MRRYHSIRASVVAGVVSFVAAPALAQGTPVVHELIDPYSTGGVETTGALSGPQSLQLEVFINDASTGLIGTFQQGADGNIGSTARELTDIGLKVPAATNPSKKDDAEISLSNLPGVSYRLDMKSQSLYITAGDGARVPRKVDLNPRKKAPLAQTGTGAVLNYSLFSSTDNLLADDVQPFRGISGGFDARFFSPLGSLDQSFSASLSDGDLGGFKRLNSTWSYSDQERAITYKAGDFVSGGLGWTRPVFLGGMQVSRNFSLRSDLVTTPMPGFTGTAAVPSTLEVYTQNARTYSADIPAGPFSLTNIPAYTGDGNAQVVIRDSLGRETRTTLSFYNTSDMLAPGMVDFSVEAGFPRRNYGTESNDYSGDPFGSATLRYGMTDRLTLESHFEGGADFINGGGGAVFSVGDFGAFTLAGAGSHHGGDTGALVYASAQLNRGSYSLYGNIQRTFGNYDDIAALSADDNNTLDNKTDYIGYTQIYSPRVPKSIVQLSLGVPTPIKGSGLSLTYTQITTDDSGTSHNASLSYSQSLFRRAGLYVSAFKDLDKRDNFGVYAGLSISFDNGIYGGANINQSGDSMNASSYLAKSNTHEIGNVGWRVRDTEGNLTNRSAAVDYTSRYGYVAGEVNQSDGSVQGNLQVEGAVAVAGGGVFATNRIDDAFAVVKVGAPNVTVKSQNRPIGNTNGSGKIIVPNLRSYGENEIEIDPMNLPVDAVVDTTRAVVVPGQQAGVVVDFGVNDKGLGAIVDFVDRTGKPLDVGLPGSLNGADDAFVVGYDGQAFLENLKNSNQASIQLRDGTTCAARFDYRANPGTQVNLKNVVCQ